MQLMSGIDNEAGYEEGYLPYHHQDHLLHQVPSLECSPSVILMALVVHYPWLVEQCFPPSLPKEFWKQASKQCHSVLPNHYLKFSSHSELEMGSKKSGWPGQCECCLVSTSSHARMLTSMSYCIGISSLSHVQTYRAFFLDSVFFNMLFFSMHFKFCSFSARKLKFLIRVEWFTIEHTKAFLWCTWKRGSYLLHYDINVFTIETNTVGVLWKTLTKEEEHLQNTNGKRA